MKKDEKEIKDTSSKTKSKKEENEKIVEENIVEVDTKDVIDQNAAELNDRINRLYGLSSNSPREEKNYDPKELEEIRKKLILLLIGLVVFGVIVIVIMINPFDFSNSRNQSDNKVQEENIPAEEDDEISLGELDIAHSLVLKLNSKIIFSTTDFMQIDLFELYRHDILDINNLSNDIKLYLLKKDDVFYEFISNEKTDEYIKTCDTNGIEIPKADFDAVVKKVFGPNVKLEYVPINYSYYVGEGSEKKLTLTFENEKLILRCNEFPTGTELTKFVQQNLSKAIKTETGVELYQNVVFINQNGVYKDPDFTILITNDRNAAFNDYINNGAMYKYTFKQDGDNYYLLNIERVKETAS